MGPMRRLWRKRMRKAEQSAFEALFREALQASANNDHERAVLLFDKASAAGGSSAELHFKRGNSLRQLARPSEAIDSYSRAISLNPQYVQAFCNRGVVQHSEGRYDEARASYERALVLNPSDSKSHYNLALLLQECGNWQDALVSYDRAIQIDPNFPEAQYNRALALLYLGDFAKGWRDYERRWECAARLGIGDKRSFEQPLWLGEQPLGGRRLLLHSEAGLGDTIQFCRYATLCAEKGASVILQVQPPLVELLRTLAGVSEVLPLGLPPPAFDMHCPLMSLPLAFGTRVVTIPSMRRYLRANAPQISHWFARLKDYRRPRIGLAWSGNPNNPIDNRRSIGLAPLLGILPTTAQYFCLQKDTRPDDRSALASARQLVSFADASMNFTETAAICECMDLVVSVDTSIAHLAGALGRPVWVPLAKVPDWRWMQESSDTPWYPTMTLFRQDTAGDWNQPLSQIAAKIRHLSGSENLGDSSEALD